LLNSCMMCKLPRMQYHHLLLVAYILTNLATVMMKKKTTKESFSPLLSVVAWNDNLWLNLVWQKWLTSCWLQILCVPWLQNECYHHILMMLSSCHLSVIRINFILLFYSLPLHKQERHRHQH
jgi:hypothetical protein